MDWTKAFLASLRKTGNVSQSARNAKIERRTVYKRREADPEFKAAWDEVIEEAMDALEEVALRRAKKGSDTLLIFLLKSRRPEIYKETIKQEHSGTVSITWADLVNQARNEDDGNSSD